MNSFPDLKDLEAVLVDLGGTLILPEPSVAEQYRETAADMLDNLPSREAIRQRFHRAFRSVPAVSGRTRYGTTEVHGLNFWFGIVSMVFPSSPPARRRDLTDRLFERFRSPARWRVIQPAPAVLEDFRDRGIRTGLVSNWDVRCRVLVEALGLEPLFDELIISSELGVDKPDPRIFRSALERLQARPDRALMVGDSRRTDLRPAEDLGMRSVPVGEPPEETWEGLYGEVSEQTG